MTIRRITYLAISLSLTAGIALAQQPTPPAAPEAPVVAEPFGQAFTVLMNGGSFLGVYAEDISRENMGKYNLREVRGAGITSVMKDSPAEKAGLRKDDVILKFDGENVTSVRKLNRLVSEVAPDQTARLTISRGGSEQEVSVTIGKRKEFADTTVRGFGKLEGPEGWKGLEGLKGGQVWKWEGKEPGDSPFIMSFGNNRRIGISTTTLTKQLADYFGIVDGKGVLVTSVAEDGAAAKAGIKAGDVITAVDGEKVEDSGDLSRGINKKKEGDVTLTVVRNKNQRSFTVTPKTISNPMVLPGTGTQMGHRIIVPRIELPIIPEMNISLPQIQLPIIPEIRVEIPTNVSRPRIRRGTVEQHPI